LKVLKPTVIVFFDPPPPFGGVRVSSTQTYSLLQKQDDVEYVSMQFSQPLFNFVFSLFKKTPTFFRAKLILYQVNGVLSINENRFIFTILLNKLFFKKMAFRGFGGGIKNAWIEQPYFTKLFQTFLINQMSFMTLQTKSDYDFFLQNTKIKTKTYWFPNTRPINDLINVNNRGKASRFCFVGKVWKEKGIDLIISAAKKLPKEISIDIFGPITEEAFNEYFNNHINNNQALVTYKGEIGREQILKTIANYDALLLPTRWITEGHPGVILESFSVGLPVIASNWNGIPELLDETSGILIDNSSDTDLVNAIQKLHNDNIFFEQLKKGAKARSYFFSPESWAIKLHEWILEQL